jgi:enamine deaminase RidA (YjgF/YER057c/UK114 family)
MKAVTPGTIAPPFATYSHGIICEPMRLLTISGQLGLTEGGRVPEGAQAQAQICFHSIDHILAEAGMDRRHILRLNAYVTDRSHMPGYMEARDAWLHGIAPPPASTLMIVSGFTRPEFVVEIEALAAQENDR